MFTGRTIRRLAAALAVLFAAHAHAQQRQLKHESDDAPQRRVALVIGNNNYAVGELRNPVNDSLAIRRALEELGFEVIHRVNQGQKGMEKAVRDFRAKLTPGTIALLYYAGHGVQIDGENYLVPVDATPENADELEDNAVKVSDVVKRMVRDGEGVNIVILDACRNNPFGGSSRAVSGGLAPMDTGKTTGIFIAYATSPGSVASDGGSSGNGVYTQELLRYIRQPGLKIEEVFKRVRFAVYQRTQGKQTPWDLSSLMGDFHFVPSNHKASNQGVATQNSVPLGGAKTGDSLSNPPATQILYNTARRLEAAGKYAEAAALYRGVADFDSGKALYHNVLGKALWNEARAADQRMFPSRGVGAGADLPARITRTPREAVSAFRQAAKLEPSNVEYLKDLIFALQYEGDGTTSENEGLKTLEEIELYLRKVIYLEPNDAALHYELAGFLKDQNKLAEAEAEYKEAIRLAPKETIYHDQFADFLGEQSRWAEVEAEYKEIVRLEPASAYRRTLLADILNKQGKWAEARAEYKEAIRLSPEWPIYHSNFADALSAQGEWAAALEEYNEALRLLLKLDKSPPIYGFEKPIQEGHRKNIREKIQELERNLKKIKR